MRGVPTVTPDLPQDVLDELALVRQSLDEGNEGKARVCARRAVGKAFTLARNPAGPMSTSEVLVRIAGMVDFPSNVRAAAQRLATSVTRRESDPFSVHPLDDALVIIDALMAGKKP